MKKVKISSLVALIITLVLFGVDTVGALSSSRDMLIQIEQPGGECIDFIGVGWHVLRLYPLCSVDEPAPSSAPILSFDLISIVVVFIALWLLCWIILCIFSKNWKKILLFVGIIAAGVLVCFIGSKAIRAYKRIPTGLISLQVFTADINPDSYYAVSYPDYVYSFVPADEDTRFGQCPEIPLQIPEGKEISKKQLKLLINAAEQLENDSTRHSKGHPFSYKVEIRISTHGGSSYISFEGYNEIPESWTEFVAIVNEICGDEYLSSNPDMVVYSDDWFCESFGVTESDIPEGGSLDQFLSTIVGGSENGIRNISGANHFMSLISFDVETTLEQYEKRLSDSAQDAN